MRGGDDDGAKSSPPIVWTTRSCACMSAMLSSLPGGPAAHPRGGDGVWSHRVLPANDDPGLGQRSRSRRRADRPPAVGHLERTRARRDRRALRARCGTLRRRRQAAHTRDLRARAGSFALAANALRYRASRRWVVREAAVACFWPSSTAVAWGASSSSMTKPRPTALARVLELVGHDGEQAPSDGATPRATERGERRDGEHRGCVQSARPRRDRRGARRLRWRPSSTRAAPPMGGRDSSRRAGA